VPLTIQNILYLHRSGCGRHRILSLAAPSQNSRSSRVFEFPQSPYTTAAATGGGGENGCSADFYCPPACLDTDRSADLRHFPHCDAFRTATLSCTGLSLALCFECSPLCLFGLLALALCSRLSTFDTVFLASSFWHRHHSGTVFLAPSFWHRLSSFLHSSTGGLHTSTGGLGATVTATSSPLSSSPAL
jgi:hypothetical protein